MNATALRWRDPLTGTARRFAAVGGAVCAVYLLLPGTLQSVLYDLVGLSAVVAVAVGIRRFRPERPASWVLVGIGSLLWVLGDIGYSTYDVRGVVAPFPSWADALYLLGYPFMSAAFLLVVRRSGVRDSAAWQEAGIGVLAVGLLSWHWLLEPIVSDPASSTLAKAVALAFPVLDLLLLLLLLRLVGARARARGPVGAMSAAIAGYLVSDCVYSVQALTGSYRSGSVVDLGWLLAYVGIGAVALHPRMVELTDPGLVVRHRSNRLRMLVLGSASLTVPVAMAARGVLDHADVLMIASAATLMLVLTTLRSIGLVRELEAVTDSLKGREKELHHRATRDDLTGLANRSVLHERLEQELAVGRQVSVVLLDLDDFKHVNDSRGHEAGDELLLLISARLTSALRPDDLVARMGGDEFAVVSTAPPQALAERLLACLTEPLCVGGSEITIGASIGVAVATADGSTSDLIRNADIAMYAAKSAGGRTAALYRPDMSSNLLTQLESHRRLALGVQLEQFPPWFQPIVDLETHRLVGFEALARWVRPGQPAVAAAEWVPAAEETGLIRQVDAQVLRAAVRQLVEWSETVPGAASLRMAVNASGRTLAEPDFSQRVLAVLREEGFDPKRLVLEVTEGVFIDDEVGARLQRLREAGVRIALDDFGTGWSSLAYLRRFPVDVLKIDRSFVTGLADGGGAEAVPAAVLQLAAALQLDVVAEGIETPEQATALRRLGCRNGQGYLLGRPLPATETAELVRRGRVDGGPALLAVPPQRLSRVARPA